MRVPTSSHAPNLSDEGSIAISLIMVYIIACLWFLYYLIYRPFLDLDPYGLFGGRESRFMVSRILYNLKRKNNSVTINQQCYLYKDIYVIHIIHTNIWSI